MIPGTNLHQFDVHNDGYFSHLPLTYVDGVILEMVVRRMPYEEFVVYLEEKCGCYFQETFDRLNLYLDHLEIDLSEYLSQAYTYDMDACVSKTIGPPKKRYCNDFSLDEIVDWAKMKVGEKYVSEFKECLTYYALANDFSLWVVAKCGQRPPRLSNPEKEDKHTCRNFNFGSLVNYKWIAKVFGENIRTNSDIRLCDIVDLVMKKYKCKVSPNQYTNARKYALTEYEKIVGEPYAMLRSYGKAFLDSNHGSTVKLGVTVNPNGKTYFNRFYVCFAGWQMGGRDGNNHIYLVAWAVVNVKNKDNWTWVLKLLEQDLGSSRGNGLTLMYDQQKLLKMSCQMLSTCNVQGIFMKTLGNNTMAKSLGNCSGQHLKPHTLSFSTRVPKSYISAWIEIDMYFVTYHNYVKPVSGMNFWPDQSMYFTVLPPKPKKIPSRPRKKRIRSVVEQTPKPKGVVGRLRNKQSVDDLEDVDVVQRGPMRDEGAGGSRGGVKGSRSKRGAVGLRGGASGSRGGASVSRGVFGGSKGGSSRSGDASGLTCRGVSGSGGASGSRGRGDSRSGGASG
nr:pentatricopeptide repeat-containing protein [Tanacetum cinerariifolium]